MNFGHFTYLVMTLIFAGIAILIVWAYNFRRLKHYTKVVLIAVTAGILFVLISEPVALSLQIWAYNPELTLDTFILGTTAEAVIYAVLGVGAIASATLVWSDCEERKLPLIRTTFLGFYRKLKDLLVPSHVD